MENNKQNKKINVLITSVSRKVSLVKAFRKALKKEKEGIVISLDANPLSAAFGVSDLFFLSPPDSSSNFIPKVLEICKKYKIKLLIPTRDEELKIFAKSKEKFSEIGVILTIPSPRTIEICSDKLKFTEFCKKNDFSVPTVFTREQVKSRSLKFPLFLNDRFGKGSKKAFKINNEDELKLYLKIVKNPIVQEFVETKEYTIDLFVDSRKNIISAVPRERIYTFGGESFIGKTTKNKILIESAVELAQRLDLIFHNTIQCFFDGKNVKFIEVNPRYGGGVNLSFAAGANTPLYLVQLAKGKRIKSRLGRFKNDLISLRYTEDFFIKQ